MRSSQRARRTDGCGAPWRRGRLATRAAAVLALLAHALLVAHGAIHAAAPAGESVAQHCVACSAGDATSIAAVPVAGIPWHAPALRTRLISDSRAVDSPAAIVPPARGPPELPLAPIG